jgi:hypothetical protein
MDNIYAIATAAAKKAGYSNFDKGSDGEEKREEIVLALKRRGMKKASYVRDEQGHKIAGQRISGKYPNRLRYLREAAKYQDRKPEKPIIEQREPADTPEKDPNRAKGGEWKGGKWESKSMWEIWKATYGATNDQARKFGQRTNVKRNPRLNPNKLGVSDIIKAGLPKQAPLRKPKIVEEGKEDDLYPTGSQFSVDRKDQVKKSLLGVLLKAKMRGLGFGAIKTDQENRGKIAQMTDTERKDQRQKLLQERARLVAHRDTLVEKVEKLKSSPKTPAPQPKPDSGEGSEAEEYFRQRI